MASFTTESAAATSPACSSLRDWSNSASASRTHRSKPSPLPADDTQHQSTASHRSPDTRTPTHPRACKHPQTHTMWWQLATGYCHTHKHSHMQPRAAAMPQKWLSSSPPLGFSTVKTLTLVLQLIQVHELARIGVEAHGCFFLFLLPPLQFLLSCPARHLLLELVQLASALGGCIHTFVIQSFMAHFHWPVSL